MRIILSLLVFSFTLTACYRLPQREEIEYRNRLENAIVETFPKKVIVVIHPFQNLSTADTNRAYLEQALPDNIEAMIEPMRSTLAYMPFDGMPFYVSDTLSNLVQVVDPQEETDFESEFSVSNTNSLSTNVDFVTNTNLVVSNTNTTSNNIDDVYFAYLTNYLLIVPTQETQCVANTTTNTNYYTITTNVFYQEGSPKTNFVSNEILILTTNSIDTNIVIVNKNQLTPTNMLMLLYEEFPQLTNYLSFFPIDIRRATEEDIENFENYRLKITNPAQWKRKQDQAKKENTNSTVDEFPSEPFEYIYHITGNYRTRRSDSIVAPVDVSIQMQIYPPQSTGHEWWEERFQQKPPVLSDILKLANSLDTNDAQSFKDLSLRTPFNKPKISARLQDEFDTYSTNFRDYRPNSPISNVTQRTRPLSLRLNVQESQIAVSMYEWLRYFHAIIINRPYTPLTITTSPSGALVYINGFYVGSTPLTYPTAPIGEQRISFLKDGFNREEILADIIPGQTNSVFYRMQALDNSAVLRVTASIPDAEVYVNSLYKGQAPVIISNLSIDTKYRVEVLNPRANLSSNRNSVYKEISFTSEKTSIDFDAQFKTYETTYKTRTQQGLLAATYVSWLTTMALLGASIYTQSRYHEAENLVNTFGSPQNDQQQAQLQKYIADRDSFAISSQATLYSTIAVALLSTGIMGWYLYSKEVYLGLDVDPQKNEWYAKFQWKFN